MDCRKKLEIQTHTAKSQKFQVLKSIYSRIFVETLQPISNHNVGANIVLFENSTDTTTFQIDQSFWAAGNQTIHNVRIRGNKLFMYMWLFMKKEQILLPKSHNNEELIRLVMAGYQDLQEIVSIKS